MITRQFRKIRTESLVLLGFALSFCVLGASAVNAQTTGSIYGSVTDQSGAVVNGGNVTVSNPRTSLKRTVTTDANGAYVFPVLPVGLYDMSVEAQGFKPTEQRSLDLQVEANLRVDFKLEVGQITERVVVTTETPQVDTVSATLGAVVEEKRIAELPLNGRNFLQLGLLQAGVTPPILGIDVVGSGTNSTPGGTKFNFSVNGMRPISNNHLLDGVNNVEPMSGAAMIVPSADVIQEFRILTNSYGAEFGRAGGSIVTVLTKRGTNDYHGALYEFLRNDHFDARNFFAPNVPALKQNQFGGTVGGPILKDKTFFFGSYEGFRQVAGLATSTTVPSLLVRQGDFSQEAVKPIDPVTGLPFPGNKIPQNRIDPVATKLLTLWPAPNQGSNIWTGAPTSTNDRNQFMARIDQSLMGGKNNITGRYIIDQGSLTTPKGGSTSPIGSIDVPGFGFADSSRFQNFMLADTHIFSPEIINDFRFSYQRAKVKAGFPVDPADPQSFGFTYPEPASVAVIPQIVLFGTSSLGYTIFNSRLSNFYGFVNNLSIIKGKHSMKVGAEVRRTRVFGLFPSLSFGTFQFNGTVTRNPLGDFLLGRSSVFSQVGGREDKNIKQTAAYFYFQDDFHISRKLTVNLGLRYELVPGFTEKDNLLTTFVPGVQSVVSPSLPRGLLRPGDPGIPSTLFPTGHLDFAPRLGVAWDPFGDGKTSVRAGYGIFYDDSALVQQFTVQQPPDIQPFFVQVNPISLADPFNGNSPFKPPIKFPLPLSPGFTVGVLAPDFQLAYIQHWNVSLQRQLTPSLAVEVAYVGNKGTNLQGDMDPNQAVWVPGASLAGANLRSRRPYNPIGRIFQVSSVFDSNYNGLQATLTQRLHGGLSFQAAYTWSKAIDNVSKPTSFFRMPGQVGRPQDMRNLAAEKGLSAFDVRNRFVLSYIYEFPFFKQRKDFVSAVLGGWRLSGITNLQSGSPFSILDTSDPGLDGTPDNDRPDVLRNPNLPSGQRTPERWFDTGAFVRFVANANRATPAFGTEGRNILFTDGIINFDAGLSKDISLGENRRLEFRWEVFNIFNHANFGVPINDLNASNFGRVLRTSTPERQMQFGLKFIF
ncbi:MAG: carboxypeptidase regulatory-like domain-containing protein [Pyrinomonadaceae bacterium]